MCCASCCSAAGQPGQRPGCAATPAGIWGLHGCPHQTAGRARATQHRATTRLHLGACGRTTAAARPFSLYISNVFPIKTRHKNEQQKNRVRARYAPSATPARGGCSFAGGRRRRWGGRPTKCGRVLRQGLELASRRDSLELCKNGRRVDVSAAAGRAARPAAPRQPRQRCAGLAQGAPSGLTAGSRDGQQADNDDGDSGCAGAQDASQTDALGGCHGASDVRLGLHKRQVAGAGGSGGRGLLRAPGLRCHRQLLQMIQAALDRDAPPLRRCWSAQLSHCQ